MAANQKTKYYGEYCLLGSRVCLVLLAFCVCSAAENTNPVGHPGKWVVGRPTSPGVRLELKEVERNELRDGTQEVTYNLIATGFPEKKVYVLWQYPLGDKPRKLVSKLYVDRSGEMMVEEFQPDMVVPFLPAPLATVLPLTIDHYQKGEPLYIGLVSEDKAVQAHTIDYPIPIEDTQGSCHLYLDLVDPNRTSFAAFGKGFTSFEEVRTESKSDGEFMESKSHANKDGDFVTMLLPGVVGKTHGTASYRVTGESCSVMVEYEWGASKGGR